MSLAKIKEKIRKSKPALKKEFGVSEIAIFGSFARNKQTVKSDIDIMVNFNRPIGLKFVALAYQLEKEIGIKTHLVSGRAIRPDFRKIIEQDLIYV